MEQETRNKLQRATQQVRRLLEGEFTEQLEGMFDILPNGNILSEPGKHLDPRDRLVRQKLVDAIEHIKAGGKKPQEAVEEYTRETAFTFLNRFVALRMLEARGLLQECVSKGDHSNGFKEFCGLAPALSNLPDGGYRLYLECLFDELSIDIKVLFDRLDPSCLLWPRRKTLTGLLDILSQPDLSSIWNQNETIGWVYQYFNSIEERKKMRDDSSAPRNSRELAVRNQFFTPRYVVEFLTDNTLGRIWYEMRKGQTRLHNQCRSMIRRPSDIFLCDGEEPPALIEGKNDLGQEELFKRTVYIPHRPKKDPRDLKILDPACGSGHFLLYAFDLLITIYEETWHDEESVPSAVTGKRLRDDYRDIAQLNEALPGLVIRHNLYGIDIDPRAAQIAALAIWMRGQCAYNDLAVSPNKRPLIGRSNIVCAEPMPGEGVLLDEFINQQLSGDGEKALLAQLVRHVFTDMKLAGEAGSILRIEEHIADVVNSARQQWSAQPRYVQQTLFDIEPRKPKQLELEFDVTGISRETFWQDAEQAIYDALKTYSSQVDPHARYTRKLFADDAERGFAFVDTCRGNYDVVLMNPPFGDASLGSKEYVFAHHGREKTEIAACFVTRWLTRLRQRGILGVICNRTFLFADSFQEWRNANLSGLGAFADLGFGVLDAYVETAAFTVEPGNSGNATFIALVNSRDKSGDLTQAIVDYEASCPKIGTIFLRDATKFSQLGTEWFYYWLPEKVLTRANALRANRRALQSKPGLQTCDNFRFVRMAIEMPQDAMKNRWLRLSKGGDYQPFWADLHLVALWENDGQEMKAFIETSYDSWSKQIPSVHLYTVPGVTYSERTTSSLSLRILPRGALFDKQGPFVGYQNHEPNRLCLLTFLGMSYCYLFRAILESRVGLRHATEPGGPARHYMPSIIEEMPLPELSPDQVAHISQWVEHSIRTQQTLLALSPVDSSFNGFPKISDCRCLDEICESFGRAFVENARGIYHGLAEAEAILNSAFDLSDDEINGLEAVFGPRLNLSGDASKNGDSYKVQESLDSSESELVEATARKIGYFSSIVKQSFVVNRHIELTSMLLGIPVVSVLNGIENHKWLIAKESLALSLVDFFLGAVFGRWDIRYALGVANIHELSDVFSEIPSIPPALLTDQQNQPVSRQCDAPSINGEPYPVDIAWDAILVDDPGHPRDIETHCKALLSAIWPVAAPTIEQDICESSGVPHLSEYFRKTFFGNHLTLYSKSRRRAPIYWQLSTPSGSYSVWLYYHRFTKDTFFKVKEIATDKLDHERQKLDRLRAEAGVEPNRLQRKAIEDQEKIFGELSWFIEEVQRIAPLWKPNLNDGVIINFAPLWRLVPQSKSWQMECKSCWEDLLKGEYDWAHLSMHLWPERVVPKCLTDASLAIAHGLEHTFWQLDQRNRFKQLAEPKGGWKPVIDDLVKQRTSPAVKAALQRLMETAAPSAAEGSRKRRTASS